MYIHTYLSPGQTIATCQRNIPQHCWAFGHCVATCCVRLATVLQHVATCCDVLGVVGSNLTIFKPEPTTPNMSQHGCQTHATRCAQQCCDMLCWHVAIVWPGLYIHTLFIPGAKNKKPRRKVLLEKEVKRLTLYKKNSLKII